MSIIQDFVQYINDYENHFHDADPGQSNVTIEILLQAEKRPVNTYWHITKQDDIDRQLYTWFCGLSILIENLYDSTKLNLTLRAISRVIKDDYQKTYSTIENALRNWTRTSDNGKKERRVFLEAVDELFHTLSTKRIPDLELLYADFIEQEDQETYNLKTQNLKTQQADELPGGNPKNKIELTERQEKVLLYMAARPNMKQMIADIESGTDISRNTISEYLDYFQEKGLVTRQERKRGACITDKGLEHAKNIQATKK
jgi:predicted transcriptional regulator